MDTGCQDACMDIYKLRLQAVDRLIRERYGEARGGKKKFADATGIEATSVTRWFMTGPGRRNIGDETAEKIEAALKLAPGTVMHPQVVTRERVAIAEEPQLPAHTYSGAAPSRLEGRLLSAFRRLSSERRAEIVADLYDELLTEGQGGSERVNAGNFSETSLSKK